MEILKGTDNDYIKLTFMDNGLKIKVYQYREALEKLEMGNIGLQTPLDSIHKTR